MPDNNLPAAVAMITAACPIAIALFTYLNYKANRLLHIKNGIYTEKLKLYRSVCKALTEIASILDKTAQGLEGRFISLNTHQLKEIAESIDNKGEELTLLLAESAMILPQHIFTLLATFLEEFHKALPDDLRNIYVIFENENNNFRDKAEKIVLQLREDLGIEKLNKNLGK